MSHSSVSHETKRQSGQNTVELVKSPRHMAVEYLRKHPEHINLTYRELERLCNVPKATIQRAVQSTPDLKHLRMNARD